VQNMTRPRHDVVRGNSSGFIDYEYAIHGRHFRSASIRVNLYSLYRD
jgi:hypothetical protein